MSPRTNTLTLASPTGNTATYNGAFLQLYLQAVTVGVLRSVRNDAVALAKRRARNFSHAAVPQSPSDDRQVLQVVGEIARAPSPRRQSCSSLQSASKMPTTPSSTAPRHPRPRGRTTRAAEAKVAVDGFSYATAAKLFDVGGASATQSIYNLDATGECPHHLNA